MVNKNKLEAALALNNLTQADYARLLGISVSATSKKMNGKSEFTLSEIRKSAELFGKETTRDIFLV